MFNASAADISLMVGASAVAATITTVFMGALSDKLEVESDEFELDEDDEDDGFDIRTLELPGEDE